MLNIMSTHFLPSCCRSPTACPADLCLACNRKMSRFGFSLHKPVVQTRNANTVIPCLLLLLLYQVLLPHHVLILSSLHILQLKLNKKGLKLKTVGIKLTVVSLSRAANLSSWAAAAFSNASCFLMRFSTSSMV